MFKLNTLIMVGLIYSGFSYATQTPAAVKIKMYKFAVSTSALCTNPQTIYSNDNPSLTNMSDGPTFSSVVLADGTYPCVIIEMSDKVYFTPSAAEGSCTIPAEDPSIEICRANNGAAPFQLVDGTTGTCAAGEQRIAIYLSTATSSSAENVNSFLPPRSTSETERGINLATALVVAGAKTGTFVTDFSNKASCQAGSWELDAPVFAFR